MAADMMGLPHDVDVMVVVVIVVPIADVMIGSATVVGVVGVVGVAAAAGDWWQLVDGLPSGIGDEMLVVDNPGGGLPAPVVLLLLVVLLAGPGFDVFAGAFLTTDLGGWLEALLMLLLLLLLLLPLLLVSLQRLLPRVCRAGATLLARARVMTPLVDCPAVTSA